MDDANKELWRVEMWRDGRLVKEFEIVHPGRHIETWRGEVYEYVSIDAEDRRLIAHYVHTVQ